MEVSFSSVSFDRTVKSRIYAEVDIPEYWVMDLRRSLVVVHREPGESGYRHVEEHPRGTSFTSPSLGGREFRVDDLLL